MVVIHATLKAKPSNKTINLNITHLIRKKNRNLAKRQTLIDNKSKVLHNSSNIYSENIKRWSSGKESRFEISNHMLNAEAISRKTCCFIVIQKSFNREK